MSVSGEHLPTRTGRWGTRRLPPGIKLDSGLGVLSGTPSASGVFNFFITVQDSAGGIAPAAGLSITTSVPSVATTTALIPSGVVGSAYSFTLAASGGTPPYSNWSVTSGSLPQGLVLSPMTGTISGTPITAAAYNFTVTVQDSTGVTSAVMPLTMVTGVAIITSSLPKATVSAP